MIVLFDGMCNFCDLSVQFIIKHDPKGYYTFASLQGDTGKALREKFNFPENCDSFILVDDNGYHDRSSAALRVCKHLNGPWKLFYPLLIIPKPIRDLFYNIVAKNRYKWFGKRDRCVLPSREIRKRFLD